MTMAMAGASTYKLVITACDYSVLIGHHQFTCHIEETLPDGTIIHGTPEVNGISVQALQSRFGGNLEQWRDWVQSRMLALHLIRRDVHTEILQWRGMRLPIEVPIVPSTVRSPQQRQHHRRRKK
jgi:hypothetical protein